MIYVDQILNFVNKKKPPPATPSSAPPPLPPPPDTSVLIIDQVHDRSLAVCPADFDYRAFALAGLAEHGARAVGHADHDAHDLDLAVPSLSSAVSAMPLTPTAAVMVPLSPSRRTQSMSMLPVAITMPVTPAIAPTQG